MLLLNYNYSQVLVHSTAVNSRLAIGTCLQISVVSVLGLGLFLSWSSWAISTSSFLWFLYFLNPYNPQRNTGKIDIMSCTDSSLGERGSLFTIIIFVWNFSQNFSNQSYPKQTNLSLPEMTIVLILFSITSSSSLFHFLRL